MCLDSGEILSLRAAECLQSATVAAADAIDPSATVPHEEEDAESTSDVHAPNPSSWRGHILAALLAGQSSRNGIVEYIKSVSDIGADTKCGASRIIISILSKEKLQHMPLWQQLSDAYQLTAAGITLGGSDGFKAKVTPLHPCFSGVNAQPTRVECLTSKRPRLATPSPTHIADGKSDEWRDGAHALLVARHGSESNALIRGLLGLTSRCDFHCYKSGRPLSAPQMGSYQCAAAVAHGAVVAAACFRHVGSPQAALGRSRAPSHSAFTELLLLAVEKRMEGHGYGARATVATPSTQHPRARAPTRARADRWRSACRARLSCVRSV